MDKWLKRLLYMSGVVLILALSTLAGVGVYQALTLPDRVGYEVVKRLDRLESTVGMVRSDYFKTSDALRNDVDVVVSVVKTLPKLVDNRLQSVQSDANNQLTTALDKADKQLTETNKSVKVLVDSTKPTLDAWASISRQVDDVAKYNLTCVDRVTGENNPRCWPSRITGIMGDMHTGLGEAALTMRTFRKSQADFIEIGKGVGTNAVRIGDNVERWTRPDKWWMTGARIAAPFAGAVIGAAVKK